MHASEESFGVIYVAFGAPFLAMAMASAASLRATNPGVPVCIVTNVVEGPPSAPWWDEAGGDRWTHLVQDSEKNRLVKTDVLRYSPFEKTLFLDCDTLVVGSLALGPLLLDSFDLILRPARGPCRTDGHRMVFSGTTPFRELPHFNGGVVGFRKTEAATEFFRLWQEGFIQSGGARDQPSLVEALFRTRARLYPLRDDWNHGDYWFVGREDRRRIVIWHYKWRSLDARMQRLIRWSVEWFGGSPVHRAEVDTYLTERRKRRKPWKPQELGRWFLRELRGPLSKVPEVTIGTAAWNRLLGRA